MREQRGEKRLLKWVNWLCAIIFSVFSFTFTAVYQSPLVEVYYDKVATGKLEYNGYVVAAITTTLLLLLALWLNKYAKFQREWSAMAYIPSFLLLAFLTDIEPAIYTGGASAASWVWVFVIGILVYILVAFLLRNLLFAKIKDLQTEGHRIVWRNLLLFTLFFCVVGWLSNGEDNFKSEAAAYSHYKRGDVDAALNVASRSLNASHELTAARAFYLANAGEMGDRLFRYPQYFGAEGLLPALQQTSPLSPDTVYAALGYERLPDESALNYLRRVVDTDSVPSRMVADYYLCALLLDKRVTEFVEELPRFYDISNGESIPMHYKEALVYYVTAIGDFEITFESDSLRSELLIMGLLDWNYGEDIPEHYKEAFKDYALSSQQFDSIVDADSLGREFARMIELEKEYPQLHIRSNYIRKHFGHTYWWYFGYSD